jgi:hypothetical protein
MRLHNLYTIDFIDETDGYPYVSSTPLEGLAIINNSTTVPMTVIINTNPPLVIPIPASSEYEGEFGFFTTISHSGGVDFDIELKRS